jgi:hypothetical protein
VSRIKVNYPALKCGACEEIDNLLHIRVVDWTRRFGGRAPKALVPVADIPRPHEVRVPFVAAADAAERVLRPSILLVNQPAGRTSETRVHRIDFGDLYATERRLVRDERSEAGETPRVEPPAVRSSASFGVVSDAGQVLEDERVAWAHQPDQSLREHMIAVAAETCQSVVESAKMPTRRSGAFALEPAAKREESFFDGSPTRIAEESSVARYGGTLDSAIHANSFPSVFILSNLLLDDDMQEPTLRPLDEISRARLEPFECLGVTVEEERHFDPTANHRELDDAAPVKPERAGIESDGGLLGLWTTDLAALFRSLADGLEGLDRLHPRRNHKLTRKVERIAQGAVGLLMELHAVRGPRLPSHSGDHIEGHRILTNRLGERRALCAINGEFEPDGLSDDHRSCRRSRISMARPTGHLGLCGSFCLLLPARHIEQTPIRSSRYASSAQRRAIKISSCPVKSPYSSFTLTPRRNVFRPLDVPLDRVRGDLSRRADVERRSPQVSLAEQFRQMGEFAEKRPSRNALKPLDCKRRCDGGRCGVEEMHMVGLDFEGENLKALGLRDLVEDAPQSVCDMAVDVLPTAKAGGFSLEASYIES